MNLRLGRIAGIASNLCLSILLTGVASPSAFAAPKDAALVSDSKNRLAAELRLVDWVAEKHGKLSLTTATLPDGKRIAEYAGDIARNPASVSKLVTAWVALQKLGGHFRFRTAIHGRLGQNGQIERLVIRGEGDPSLTSEQIMGMAARLSAMGVTRIDSIVVDQSYFDDQVVPPAFEQQPGEWAGFRAPVAAASVDRNRVTLRVLPCLGGRLARAFVEPFGAATISGQVRCVVEDTKGAGVNFSVVPADPRPIVKVDGEIGNSESGFSSERRLDDPRRTIGYVLREALAARRVAVPPEIGLGGVEGLPVLETHQSESLATLLHRLGKDSDNFAAEMLLKKLGAQVLLNGSSEAGSRVISESLAALGPLGSGFRWVNGSGLFDANRLSTNTLLRLLGVSLAELRIAPEYLAQMSIGGTDGTLHRRFGALPEGCTVRAKTGTLRRTVSLAGYVTRKDARVLGFAVIVEDLKDAAAIRAEIDRYVESLCTVPLEPAATGK